LLNLSTSILAESERLIIPEGTAKLVIRPINENDAIIAPQIIEYDIPQFTKSEIIFYDKDDNIIHLTRIGKDSAQVIEQ